MLLWPLLKIQVQDDDAMLMVTSGFNDLKRGGAVWVKVKPFFFGKEKEEAGMTLWIPLWVYNDKGVWKKVCNLEKKEINCIILVYVKLPNL